MVGEEGRGTSRQGGHNRSAGLVVLDWSPSAVVSFQTKICGFAPSVSEGNGGDEMRATKEYRISMPAGASVVSATERTHFST